MLQVQLLVAYQRQNTSRCADNNVRRTALKSLLVLLNRQTAKEDCNLQRGKGFYNLFTKKSLFVDLP